MIRGPRLVDVGGRLVPSIFDLLVTEDAAMRRHLREGSRSGLRVGGPTPALRRLPPIRSKTLVDACIGSAILAATSLTVSLGFRLALGAKIGAAGIAVLIVAKLAAVTALNAGDGWRGTEFQEEKSSLIEAATMGSLLAFVASLAFGNAAPLPRSVLLADWGATIGVFLGIRWFIARNPSIQINTEPEILATFRDRTILANFPEGRSFRALRTHLRSLEPKQLKVVHGEAIDQIKAIGPDVIFQADDGSRASALATRALAIAALKGSVPCFVLVTSGVERGAPTMAEQVVRAFSGLTTTRMIRIRAGRTSIDAGSARRIARIAAKGRDGTAYPVTTSEPDFDAETLWKELDAGSH